MKHAKAGSILDIRPECLDYHTQHDITFYDMKGNVSIDTTALSVSMIGIWNKTLLERLGSPGPGRSLSVHLFRTCVLTFAGSRGKELSLGIIKVMIRWVGWQAVTGAKTVLRTYAREETHKCSDPYSLSLDHELRDKVWEARRKEYLGVPQISKEADY